METTMPALLIVGLLAIVGYYFGQAIRRLRLPSIIGFMLLGVLFGPSVLNVIDAAMEEQLSFVTQVALGLVALGIGLELRIGWLRSQGFGLVFTILGQCFGAFIAVAVLAYAVVTFLGGPDGLAGSSQYLALCLLFGAMATATAPAGTAAVIHEYKAKGSLTQAIYAVVGYDDALAIIIYGFAAAIARGLLIGETGNVPSHMLLNLLGPLREIVLGLIVGAAVGALFCVLARNLSRLSDVLILTIGFVLATNGLSTLLHLPFILTNMVFGFVVGNTQPHGLIQRIHDDLNLIMPLFFIFLFGLAGANLHVSVLPHLGILGLVYILARSAGKILGAGFGATVGGMDEKIRKYLGPGLLSQAGVAIGLALIARQTLRGIGGPVHTATGASMTSGDIIGSIIITTITASCVIFEIIGPISLKIALTKAGEIPPDGDGADSTDEEQEIA